MAAEPADPARDREPEPVGAAVLRSVGASSLAALALALLLAGAPPPYACTVPQSHT